MPKTKSLEQQLQESIDAGNLEAAKLIVEAMKELSKIKKVKAKKKPAKKAAPKKPKGKVSKKKVPKTIIDQDTGDDVEIEEVKPKRKKLIIPTEAEIIDLTGDDEDDLDDGDDDDGPELVRQGKSRRRGEDKGAACRTERIDCKNRKIEFFNGNKSEGDAAEDSPKNNPILAKLYKPADAARPHREARKVVKAKVKCLICRKVEVISLDVAPRKGESYKCNSCVTSQGE